MRNYLSLTPFVLATILASFANAHTQLYGIEGPDGSFEQGKYIIPSSMGNAPVVGDAILTDSLRCRSASMSTTGIDALDVTAGNDVTFRYYHKATSQYNNSPVMSRSHMGPCTAYMAPVSSKGDGKSWFKVFYEGYDADEKKWCTTKVIDNDGDFVFTVPKNIPSGLYYARTELFAIHQATASSSIQMYPGCALINVVNGGSFEPTELGEIPGIYNNADDPGLTWTRGQDPTKYPGLPGPELYNATTGASS
ncbi:hypothetical protein FB645_005685 [Coemansia sp. IMI 203386]|nr:hypothetical protein FB645_005685 [Coemansia sp. IMI 203386]